MKNPSINWHEGLFLRPQHLQAADRYWTSLWNTAERWSHPFGYGLHAIEISGDALGNQTLHIRRIQARLPDGSLIDLEAGQELDRLDLTNALGEVVDLSDAFANNAVLRIYIGIPKLRLGLPNVSAREDAKLTRYLSDTVPVQDENEGGNDQEIDVRSLNVRVLLSTEDLSGFDVLPIAQVRRVGDGEAVPQLDTDYVPPVLTIDAWDGLGLGLVQGVYDLIGQKTEVLSQQLVNRGIGLDTRHPGDFDRILMLTALNEASATLSTLVFTRGVHPFAAYTVLCEIVGRLSIFDRVRRLTELPRYDHDNLGPVFRELRDRIEKLINSIQDYEYRQRFFLGVGLGMQASLEPQWFNSDWQWFIGVKKGNLTEPEVRDLLSPGHLDWKLGSSRQVEMLFKNRMPGIDLEPLNRSVRALPAGQEWVFYEVPRRDSPAWRDVQETQTLAMRLKDSLIVNLDRLQGERQMIVTSNARRIPLEFALFAVPDRL